MKFENQERSTINVLHGEKDKIKLPIKLVSRGIEVYTVEEITLPLLIEQVFTRTQTSGTCWNL